MLKLLVDSDLLVIFPNDLIFSLDGEPISLKYGFKLIDDFFYQLLQNNRIFTNMPVSDFTIRENHLLQDVIAGKRILVGPFGTICKQSIWMGMLEIQDRNQSLVISTVYETILSLFCKTSLMGEHRPWNTMVGIVT